MIGALGEPRDWTERALCSGLVYRDYDPWCPDPELTRTQRQRQVERAKAICATCPVMLECAAEAITQLPKVDEHAIRGGMTPAELAGLAKKLGLPHRRQAQHGARSRYVAGCRCEDCKRAHADYEHERRLQTRKKVTAA